MRTTTVVISSLLLLLSGCAKSAPEAGKVVSIENACKEADKTRVRVNGYLRYQRSLLSFCSNYGGKKTCDLMLYATAEDPGNWSALKPRTEPAAPQLKLSVPVGDAPGEMAELPEKFTAKDIVVHLPEGKTAAEGAKVTIDGTLSIAPSADPAKPGPCWITVEWAS